MTEYHAKAANSLTFEITRNGRDVGKLSYKSWFKFDAVIDLADHSTYQVEPKGFWGTTIELSDRSRVLLKFKMNWNGQIVVQTYFNNVEKGYVFKHVGVFKESFVLADADGVDLLVMKPHLKWSKLNYEYQITTTDAFETTTEKDVLLMTSVHCANYYMSMMMSAT